MGKPRVVEILIAEAAELPMKTLSECDAVAGRGLQGDRYFSNIGTFSPNPQKPDFEITLIEIECVEAFARQSGLAYTGADARRNIVTEGIQLNHLVGSQFTIGDVLLQGIPPLRTLHASRENFFSRNAPGLSPQRWPARPNHPRRQTPRRRSNPDDHLVRGRKTALANSLP
jgi:hypothetical protein